MRLVNPNDAVLVGCTGANFMICGRVRVVADLFVAAGKPVARDGAGADGFALVALEHLTVMGKWLAIERQNLRWGVAGHVIYRHQVEVEVTDGESEVCSRVVVRILV